LDLTPKQQLFVDEYLKDRNATQAAIRAGYSPKSADVNGPRLLGNARISDAIGKAVSEASGSAKLSREDLLKELSKGAFHKLDMDNWRPADKLKAIEIIAKLLGYFDATDTGNHKDESAKQRVLDAAARLKARQGSMAGTGEGSL
jgi:phage terminase small subunit